MKKLNPKNRIIALLALLLLIFNVQASVELTVDLLQVSPLSNLDIGDSVQVQIRVKNTGTSSSGGFRVGVYYSVNTTITSNDTYLADVNIPNVVANSVSPIYTVTVFMPNNITNGIRYIGAIADYTNVVAETNESNNTRASSIYVMKRPDFEIENLTLNTGAGGNYAGKLIQAVYRVKNNGSVTSTAKLRLYFSTNSTITTSDTYLLVERTITLTGFSSSALYFSNVRIPYSALDGVNYIGCIIDFDDQVVEKDETNNTKARPITISNDANLIVDFVDVVDTAITAGTDFTVNYRVKNTGVIDADTFKIRLYYSNNATITQADVYLNVEKIVPNLAPNAVTQTFSSIVSLPSTLSAGVGYVGVIVDYDNQVDEISNYDNSDYEMISICSSFSSLSSILGDTIACVGDTMQFKVSSIPEAIAYQWELPSAWSGASSDSVINCITGNNGGQVSVSAINSCGSKSVPQIINVNVVEVPTPIVSYVNNHLYSSVSSGNQWFMQGDGAINGATNQDYIATESGNYFVIAEINGCYSDTSNIVTISMSSIKEEGTDAFLLELYPNPVVDKVTLNIKGEKLSTTNVYLFDANGKLLRSEKITKQQTILDMSNLTKGVYFVRVESKSHTQTKRILLVK